MKVFRRITSSPSSSADTLIPGVRFPFAPLKEYSLKVKESGPIPLAVSLFS